ncbi:glycoside hydrolase family 20 protein [Xylona heveae TC161]|uniref:Beta-hexosaminidase n=1 Tax=Xylona heveae (strain CBS 132557 / TC161) TaxID=1328760 RepID=A0A165GNC0_XYLHT|nr:glycoside hydrolase family 20 protein [Xylona heveae TC161]KZF22399.1 glycoside hydrolase family 20 protein [Xylona heveae TC161]
MMKSLLLSAFFSLSLLLPSVSALWPIPSNYSNGTSVVWLSPDVRFDINGVGDNNQSNNQNENEDKPNDKGKNQNSSSHDSDSSQDNSNPASAHAVVQAAVDRAYYTIFTENFIPWKFHPRHSDFEPAVTDGRVFIKTVSIYQNQTTSSSNSSSDNNNLFHPTDGELDESYTLLVTADGAVNITSVTPIGILRALETFTQLFYQHSHRGAGVYSPYAPVTISDAPVFVHRGLNMDVARNYYTPKDIMRTIDALSYNKMNRLHLHATDAQSWPLEIPSLPDLALKGSYRTGYTYSPDDLAEIQTYGAYRGVEVYIEIDTPGHTASIWFAYPELITAFNVQPDWDTYSAEPPSGQLKLNSTAVTQFIDALFADLLPRVSPFSSAFHTGGDEVNVNAYLLDDTVQSNSTTVIQPLLQDFVSNMHARILAQGMTPLVWEEMLLVWNLTLDSSVIVQTWLSDASVADTVSKGHKALAGNYNYWYLDCGKGQWLDFYGPAQSSFWPYADYCSPTKNWRLVYSYDPLAGVPDNATHLVLGGEVHIWSEQTDPVILDSMLWPRAAAAAEVLWSGAKDAQGQNRSQVEASPRLAEMRERLVARGIGAGPVQMVFCTQNGTQCALA